MLVAVAAAAVYVNSLPGEFVFDDHEAIENNPDVRSVAHSKQQSFYYTRSCFCVFWTQRRIYVP